MEGMYDVMNIFYIEEHNGKYLVKPNLSLTEFNTSKITGSWGVFCARVMGLSYANYLRMCRDMYGAEIVGKNIKYPSAFLSETNAKKLMKVLESRWKEIKKVK